MSRPVLVSFISHSFELLLNTKVRLSAALEIKVILAEILLNYDLSFPTGTPHKPKLFSFNLFTVPSPTAKLTFTCKTQ